MLKLLIVLLINQPVDVPIENSGLYDLNGGNLVCDADGDTYMNCATDDQCDWYIHGTLRARCTTTGCTYYNPIATSVTAAGTDISSTSTDGGGTGITWEAYQNSATPADGDVINAIREYGEDSASNKQEYCRNTCEIQTTTSGAEDGIKRFYAVVAGTVSEFLRLDGTVGTARTVLSKILDVGGYDVVDNNPATTDADPDNNSYVLGQHAYAQASTAAYKYGGDVFIGGGQGSTYVDCDAFDANADNDTLKFYVYRDGAAQSVVTITAKNGGAGAGQFNCVTDVNTCCANLYAYLVANPVTGVSFAYTAATDKVYVTPNASTNYVRGIITNSAGSVFATWQESVPGRVRFIHPIVVPLAANSTEAGQGTPWGYSIGTQNATATCTAGGCMYWFTLTNDSDNLIFKMNNVAVQFSSSSGAMTIPSGWYFSYAGATKTLASTDGKLAIQKAAGTGAGFDVTTANRISLTKADGTTLGEYAVILAGTLTADMSSVARQTIYTVPTGFTFYPHYVSIGPCSAVIDAAEGAFGSDTPAADFHAAISMAHSAAASVSFIRTDDAIAVPSIAAAGTFAYDGTNAEGAADTCTMSVYGVLR